MRHELKLLTDLGYRRFKVVAQKSVRQQVPPYPSKEGAYVERVGATGLFGEELPGRWLTASQTIATYAFIYMCNKALGASRRTPGLARLVPDGTWYDTHAAL